MFLLAFIFTAFGTALASKVEDMQAFPLIMNFIIMPVFFLSGAIFPLESAHPTIKAIAVFDPLSYQIDALREIFTGVSHFGLAIDFAVTGVCIVLATMLGVYLFIRVEV